MRRWCPIVAVFVVAVVAVFPASRAFAQRSTPVQLLHPSGAGSDQFGQSVAIDGDTMIVGSPFDDVGANTDQGSAHVYRWTGSGWAFEATLNASGGALGDNFGIAVALSGDTAIVGAERDDVGAISDQGSAYVFVRSGTTWTQQAQLTASDGAATDRFGISVAVSGDTVLVGSRFDNVGATVDQGSAYVFVRSGTTWTQQAQLTASDGATSDQFGASVTLSSDTAIVGAFSDDVGANANQGSAYVFVRSGTTWVQQGQLTAADGSASDQLGVSVAISGDTAIVGANLDDVGASTNQGSVYVFVRSGTIWTQQTQLVAVGGAANDQFGLSVAVDGDTVIVGALFYDVGANTNQGSAYVFTRTGTTWTQQAQLAATDGAGSDFFGISVAISGDTAIVGAYTDDVGANINQGSAWVFSRIGSTWIGPDLQLLASDGAAGDQFGQSVAVDGDTAIVGANIDDVGGNGDQGSAYVFVRSGTTWTQQAQLTASDGAAVDNFGVSVAISGDTAIVGAVNDDVGANANQGSAYVFVRSGTTWTQQTKLTATGGAASDRFGISVALSGDTAIVGADSANVVDDGSAYVFVRSGTTWTQQDQLTATGGAAGDAFGCSVALSGDTAIVGAYLDDVGANSAQGSACVFERIGTIWRQQAQLTSTGGDAGDNFGYSVALSGDTAIVGAYSDDVGANGNQGSAYVFTRSGTTWTQQAQLTAANGAPGDNFGISVALSVDTAIVGASGDDVVVFNDGAGSACVFVRSGTTWTQQAQLTAADVATNDRFGDSVAISGDTAIVGAYADDVGANANQGSTWIVDIASNDFSLAHNDVTDVSYPTLAAAMLPATSGHQITATEAAWRGIGSINTFGRSLGLYSSGDLRTPSTSVLDLSGSSALAAPVGASVEILGQLRSAGYVDVTADSFRLGSRGILTARTGSSLTINSPTADLDGQARVEQGASITAQGDWTNIGPVSMSQDASLTSGGTIRNIDTWTMSVGGRVSAGTLIDNRATWTVTAGELIAPLFRNVSQTNIFGSSAVFGSFTNEAGATTTIRSGTLFVFGSLTNNGTIVGTICSNCIGTPPNLDVGGDLIIGPASNLLMPFTGSIVHIGGDFDCAINSNTRYDMSLATLQLEGTGAEQTLEVMSTDIGPDSSGLDRTLAGHYPVGVLEIGPSPSTVRLADTHDNDGMGQSYCEAIYADEVIIHAGSRRINTSCRIYYNTLTNNGTVDAPENLVPIGAVCNTDYNQDGGGDNSDVTDLANDIAAGTQSFPPNSPDFNQDGGADNTDVTDLANTIASGQCP